MRHMICRNVTRDVTCPRFYANPKSITEIPIIGTITCCINIVFTKHGIHIDENIDIKNQSSFEPTIQLKNKPWKTQVIPEINTILLDAQNDFFATTL